MHTRPLTLVVFLALLMALAAKAPAPAFAAASIVVDPSANDANNNADGKCSLYEALQAISQGSTYNQCSLPSGATGPFTITFSGSGTLKVPGGTLPYVTKNVAITGPVIIEGSGNDTTIVVAGSGILSLTNLTMTKGSPALMGQGSSAVINIAGCSFVGNTNDGSGGAISSDGKLNIAGSAFSGNTSDGTYGGGAIWASGYEAVAIAGTAFNGNVAKRSGGAIYALAPATLTDVVFNGNIANAIDPNNNGTDNDGADDYTNMGGGALFVQNDSTNGRKTVLTRVVFNGNITGQGSGGALFHASDSTLEIQDSAFNGNLAGKPPSTQRIGGALVNMGGTVRVTRTTLLNNAVVGDGGAIANDRDGPMTLSNVSITANAATGRGGGIFNFNTQTGSDIRPLLNVLNVTLALNAAQGQGGGIYAQAPSSSHPEVAKLTNTIVSGSDGPGLGGNCAGGGVQSQGHNLDSDASCGFGQAGDLSSADAKLNAPGFNGGPIPELLSHKLGAGSAAADAGDDAVCAAAPVDAKDVRGEPRPQGARCDIGAFEAAAPVAGFGSTPVRPGPISFGNVTFGASQDVSLSVFNTGDKTLALSGPAISGPNAADFALLTPFPLNVDAPTSLALRCAPTGSTPGPRTATLTFGTNDPQAAGVSFTLSCNAVAQPVAGFGATPAAPGPIDFGAVLVGQTKVASITFDERGTAPLNVASGALGGANPADFSIGVGFSFTIADGGAPVVRGVSCAPTAPGLRSATLAVTSNDPAAPAVTYNLICTGKVAPAPALDAPSATTPTGSGIPALNGPYGVAVSPDGRHVYAVGELSDSVHVYTRNQATGQLALVQSLTDPAGDLDGAIRVFVSADGANVYVTAQAADTIVAYSRSGETGFLTKLDSVTNGDGYGCLLGPCQGAIAGLDGAYGVAISADGQFLYVSGSSTTGSGGSSITVLRRGANGDLVATVNLPPTITTGPRFVQRVVRDDLEGVYDLALSPDGAYLYAASYSNNPDAIVVLRRSAADGTLTYVDTVDAGEVAGLVGVFRLSVSPDGADLYAASYDSDNVSAFRRNPADGRLTHIATYSDGGQDAVGQTIDGLDAGTSVAVSPDGGMVYASGALDDAVVAFERDPATGALLFAGAVKRSGGQPPLDIARDVALSPDGRTVHASGYGDDTIVTLRRPNPAPAALSLAPASATAGSGDLLLAVNGEGFAPGAAVRWNGALDLPTTFVHSGKVTATVSAALLAAAGSRTVAVRNPAPGGGTSNALTFTISAPAENPVPSVDELSPAGAAAGWPALTLTVKGAGFLPSSLIRWNGQSRATTYVSATTLQVQVTAADLAQPGGAAVTVVNGGPGGGTSNAAGFDVAGPGENPVPSITSLSPAFVTAGANGALDVTVIGVGFVPGAAALWNGAPRPTTFVSAGELRIAVDAADLVAVGDSSIAVVNPGPGGGESNVAGFRVGAPSENPAPSILRVASTVSNPDGSLTVTLEGGGFMAGSQAFWGGQARATALVSATQLTVTVSAADFTRGSAVVTVSNPGPGGGLSNELLYLVRPVAFPVTRR